MNNMAPVPKRPIHLINQPLLYSPRAPPHEKVVLGVKYAKQVLKTNSPNKTYLTLRHKLKIGFVKNKFTPSTKKKVQNK